MKITEQGSSPERIAEIRKKCESLGEATGTTIIIASLDSKTAAGTLSITDNVTGKSFYYCLPNVENCLKNEKKTALYITNSKNKRNQVK